jgi:hypothetical protein
MSRGHALNTATDLVKVADGTEIWGTQYTRQLAEVSTLDGAVKEKRSKRRAKIPCTYYVPQNRSSTVFSVS